MVKEMTNRADALRKRQQYTEAAAIYEEAWQRESSPYVARWLIYCRRKAGDLDGAAAFATAALDRFPDHPYLRTEYAWVCYDGRIKEARERGNLDQLIACAEETLGLSADELLIARVAQTVVKMAKGLSQTPWEVIAAWAALVNPERLSDQRRTTGDGKTFMSEREEWYVGLAKALLETGQGAEARRVAQEGLQQFPGEIFLLRTAALALFHGGEHEAGAAEMRALRHLPRFDWYMKAELAEMESRLGRTEEAYRLVCEALGNRQDDKFKLRTFEMMAELALRLGKPAVAAAHVRLAGAIRTKEGWKLPAGLEELEVQIREALAATGEAWPSLPEDVRELSRRCRELRQGEGTDDAAMRARTEIRCTGTIMKIDPGRPFTFIKPDGGGEAVFVAVRELPPDCAGTGAGVRVTFALEESFDRKKNRASVRAVQVKIL